MMNPSDLGKRIKKVREARNMTLKKVEALAGVSATHVSEIERGKTSPTVGALMKIAEALGKDPAYFIEEDELNDISFVALEDRIETQRREGNGSEQRLTQGIPGGKLNAYRVTLHPSDGSAPADLVEYEGDTAILVLGGQIDLRLDGGSTMLEEGDSAYVLSGTPCGVKNASSSVAAEFLWASTHRGEP